MNIEEIRDRAPDGATHYHFMLGDVYYIKSYNFLFYWFDTHMHEWYRDLTISISELKPLY